MKLTRTPASLTGINTALALLNYAWISHAGMSPFIADGIQFTLLAAGFHSILSGPSAARRQQPEDSN